MTKRRESEDERYHAAQAEYLAAALRDYALAATKTITGLAGGGSELFSGQIGDIFKADLQVCASKVHDRHEKMHGLLVKSKKDADALRAENERLREAIKPTYLGLLVLKTMCSKAGLNGGVEATVSALAGLVTAMPELPAIAALRAAVAPEQEEAGE